MSKYLVEVPEIWIKHYLVDDAKSEEEAIDKVDIGECHELNGDDDFYMQRVEDKEEWVATKITLKPIGKPKRDGETL